MHRQRTRRSPIVALLTAAVVAVSLGGAATAAQPLELLTEPYLQLPDTSSVRVAWVTEFPGETHLVLTGDRVAQLDESDAARIAAADNPRTVQRRGIRVASAETIQLSRTREDSSSRIPDPPSDVVERELWRHVAEVRGLRPGARQDYRVLSVARDGRHVMSDTYSLAPSPRTGDDIRVLLTSDHQSRAMAAANLQKVEEVAGQLDAVFFAGDLVNIPDRASEWFDDTRGGAFFPVLQGTAARAAQSGGEVFEGGEIIQHVPLYPVVGNHEVMGRVDERDSLGTQYNRPVPVEVAEEVYEEVAKEVNPTGDPEVRAAWIEDNSFSTTTYEELFDLPTDSPGGETYWATTIGDTRVIGLYATRIWRTPNTNTSGLGRFVEPTDVTDPLRKGYGTHIFESLDEGSEQLAWLADELASPAFRRAERQVVVMHHAIHSIGDNVLAPFTDPVRIEERDESGELTRIRYEYPKAEDQLVEHVAPLLQDAGVDLVLNGHSHLWNRFESNGTNYLETSNVGNSFGAYHESSGRTRRVPPAPWDQSNYTAQGDPSGLEPIVPTVAPFVGADGLPDPFVASNQWTVFSVLDTGTDTMTSYAFDTTAPDSDVIVLDELVLD